MNVGQRIQQKMAEKRISQNRLAKAAQISQSGLSSIISGAVSPKEVTLSAIAKALDCSVSELMGEYAPGVIPIVRNAVPVIGSIACGERITPDTEKDGYTDLPDGIHADFALRCKGDSMIPTFLDGDLVHINIALGRDGLNLLNRGIDAGTAFEFLLGKRFLGFVLR